MIDTLFKENFKLKKEIAFEKKKNLDLTNAFLELRNEIKQQENEREKT